MYRPPNPDQAFHASSSATSPIVLIDLLSDPRTFTLTGVGILASGVYVLARGASARRRLSFFQCSLATGLWVVVYGTLLEPTRSPDALQGSADLFVFLGLLVATTAYQFVSYGLRFGHEPAGDRERKRGVVLMWAITAAVGMLLASGDLTLVTAVALSETDPILGLHWHAIPVVVGVWAGLLSALVAAGRAWRAANLPERSSRASWVMAAVCALMLLPLTLHTPLFGAWGRGAAGLSTLAGAVILAGVARLEPSKMRGVSSHVRTVLQVLQIPTLAVERDRTIQAVNDAFCAEFDCRESQVLGKDLNRLVEDRSGSAVPLSALSLDVGKEGREVHIQISSREAIETQVTASELGHVNGEALPTLFSFVPGAAGTDIVARGGPVDRWLYHHFRPEPAALAIFGLGDGQFTAANDQFLQYIGYTREDLIGRTSHDLDLAVNAHRWDDFVRTIGNDGHAEELELDVRRGGGGVQHLELYGVRAAMDHQPHGLIFARDVTARKRAEEKLRGEILYDSLTGLPNRTLFQEQMKQAMERAERHRSRMGVLFIDLDGFKAVNDTHGHAAGDQLLAGVAWRLYESFRQMDILCRYGGDEFLVLLEDLEDREDAAAAADRFRRQLKAPFRLESGTEVRVGATIGIAVSTPGQGGSVEDLIEGADVAMYRAKREGESPIRLYDPERDAGDRERLSQADELRKAIERGEMALLYQPLVSLENEECVGAEALVRWPDPSGEMRSPGEFLPLAEETGLIVPMSEWIFAEAARTALAWRETDPTVKVSVNVASQHFRDPSLPETLNGILTEVGLPPAALQLEITETAALADTRAIDRLQDLGVQVAIDDFGTGYSSLEYIRGLAVDGVKIDQAFISGLGEDPKDQAIVRAVLLMADAFDLEVTAEGIETDAQLSWLREVGCDLGQGFYFSRPMPADQFEALLAEQRGARE